MTNRPDLRRVRTVRLPTSGDPRGFLTAIEGGQDTPFEIKRVFYMWGTGELAERGQHAHRDTEQLLVCVAGSLTIDVSDPWSVQTYHLHDPAEGLYLPPMVWTSLYDFTPRTVCLAAASTHYDNAKVIRDWNVYCEVVNGS